MAPDLRTIRVRKVQFDNSTDPIIRRRQRLRTPRASQGSQATREDADDDQGIIMDEDEGQEEDPIINTLIEVKRVIDNVKGTIVSGDTLKITAQIQLGNIINEKALKGELESLHQLNISQTRRWLNMNSEGWSDL